MWMAAEGTSMRTPGGMYWPLLRVMPLSVRRVKEAVEKRKQISIKVFLSLRFFCLPEDK